MAGLVVKGGRGRGAVFAGVAALVVAGTAAEVLSGGASGADDVAATVGSKHRTTTTRLGTAAPEARGWQNAGLTDIAEMPRPPGGDSVTRTSELLAERCGVAAPTDTPVGVTP